MFVRQKKNKSGSTSVVVVEKENGRYKVVKTIGSSKDASEIERMDRMGKEWIRRQSGLSDMFIDNEEKNREKSDIERLLSNIENILVNGDQLILDRIFDKVGFNQIDERA